MKNILFSIFLILVFNSVNAQDNQIYKFNKAVLYSLNYNKDSINPKKDSTIEFLLLGDGVSLTGGAGNINMDTSFFMKKKRGIKDAWKTADGGGYKDDYKNDFRIIKQKSKIITYAPLFTTLAPPVRYEEDKADIHWVLKSDAKTIGSLSCQKAECDFGGRHWIAWFCPKIPISDGPYKFCGLPGLIIEVADRTNSWSFNLLEIKNLEYHYPTASLYRGTWENKIINSTKGKFFEIYRNSQENALELEKQYVGLNTFGHDDKERATLKALAAKDNNWIELKP